MWCEETYKFASSKEQYLVISGRNNFLLTEREGRTGEYWP